MLYLAVKSGYILFGKNSFFELAMENAIRHVTGYIESTVINMTHDRTVGRSVYCMDPTRNDFRRGLRLG